MIDRLKGSKVVGIKQTIKAIKNGSAKTVYVSKDADTQLINSIKELTKKHSLDLIEIDTMKELGRLCGIDVGSASAAMLK